MTANIKQVIAAGFDRMYYWRVGSDGYIIGSTGTAPAAGNTNGSGAAKADGVKTAEIAIPEGQVVQVTGDNQALGTFIFPPSELPSFNIEVATMDLTLEALMQDTLTYDDGDTTFGALAPTDPVYNDIGLLFLRDARGRATGSIGAAHFEGVLIPKATMQALGSSGFKEREGTSYRYKVIANPADKFPWGLAIDATTVLGTPSTPIIPFIAENRVHVHRFTGNNTQTAFVLQHTPVAASSAKVRVYVNGVKKTYTTDYTVNTGTKTVTFGSAPANNAIIVVHYEFVP